FVFFVKIVDALNGRSSERTCGRAEGQNQIAVAAQISQPNLVAVQSAPFEFRRTLSWLGAAGITGLGCSQGVQSHIHAEGLVVVSLGAEQHREILLPGIWAGCKESIRQSDQAR